MEPSAADKTNIEAAFTRADANGDGKLSREEVARMPVIADKFDTLDKNKDGFLSMEEFAVGAMAAQK
jgi:Ca2+-binding EF-hand superfamily protein